MEMDMDRDNYDYEALFFRQEKLRRLLSGGSALLMGHGNAMNGYMEENGVLSLKRTEAFIEQLVASMRIYLSYRRQIELENDEIGYYKMQKEEEQYYRDYLYCSLISLYIEQALKNDAAKIPFSILIKKAQGLKLYESYQDLLRQKFLDPEEYSSTGGRFFFDELYLGSREDLYRDWCEFYDNSVEFLKKYKLTDASGKIPAKAAYPYCANRKEWQMMLDSLSEEVKKKRQKEIDDEEELLYSMAENAIREAMKADGIHAEGKLKLVRSTTGHMATEEFERTKNLLEKIDLRAYRNHLRRCLLNQDCLYDQYNHIDAVRGMINVFLMKEKASILSDADQFYSVYVRIESAFNYAEKLVAERKTGYRGSE